MAKSKNNLSTLPIVSLIGKSATGVIPIPNATPDPNAQNYVKNPQLPTPQTPLVTQYQEDNANNFRLLLVDSVAHTSGTFTDTFTLNLQNFKIARLRYGLVCTGANDVVDTITSITFNGMEMLYGVSALSSTETWMYVYIDFGALLAGLIIKESVAVTVTHTVSTSGTAGLVFVEYCGFQY